MFTELKSQLNDLAPQTLQQLLLDKSIRQTNDGYIQFPGQSLQTQFQETMNFLKSPDTLSLNWDDVRILGQTIDGDYLAGDQNETTFFIPSSLLADDTEIHQMSVIDALIALETGKLDSAIISKFN
ncbi:hypothetical protein [Dellaglioa algida]|uniref:hypothetical protein n=1 Tax=Dellaglioa algida TaxID=105612 RepID=UPI000BC4332E|nr:hypothetical protein [Dellaglioa algida]MDK1718352.1 hypothetical protein [Dellaglioa algida]MDK1728137.1 hypothetical protein [Dellaglioa algida]MDK1729556.1 hypothetical protein [Dellaglioa algida]MDK1735789.1 hypothetical protein [Dellaglioa algida]MDK1737468.1 hypothetical protein [Dellaglioa algida]